jgi:hypothetical protein
MFDISVFSIDIIVRSVLLTLVISEAQIRVTVLSKARTVFARSNDGTVVSNLTQGTGVCVCVYSVFVLSCV